MSIYLYELPTTGAISFTDFCSEENGTYVAHISEATQARANLRGALKDSKRTDHSEKDFLKIVKVGQYRIYLMLGYQLSFKLGS